MPEEPFSPTTRYGYTEAEIKAHREAWLKDLESGEYAQGKGALVITAQDGSKAYCCMGVACESARKSGLALNVEQVGSTTLQYADGSPSMRTIYDGTDAVLPGSLRNWLGVASSNPIVFGHTLASWNDGATDVEPVSFLSIAGMLRDMWDIPKEEIPEAPEAPEE